MDFKVVLPLPIDHPISETFQKDLLTTKISFSVITHKRGIKDTTFMLITTY